MFWGVATMPPKRKGNASTESLARLRIVFKPGFRALKRRRDRGRILGIIAALLFALKSIGYGNAGEISAEERDRRAAWIKRDHQPPVVLLPYFSPPKRFDGKYGKHRSPLRFYGGTVVRSKEDWQRRRKEIRSRWHEILGPWPAAIRQPSVERVAVKQRGRIREEWLRLGIALDGEPVNVFLLSPEGKGPYPAVVVVYYDAQTGAGYGAPQRDFAWQLAKRGFVTLSMGMPGAGVNLEDPTKIPRAHAPYFGPVGKPVRVQPLSALAYAAVNARHYLATHPKTYPDRIGIVGHSFGGKWALFASCLSDAFDCAVWSDPGIVFDDSDRRKLGLGGNINYWDLWYLGYPLGRIADAPRRYRFRKTPGPDQPRTGSYKILRERGHDLVELHALMAPRPLLVSGGSEDPPERWLALNHLRQVNELLGYRYRVALTSRRGHSPTPDSNSQVYRFFEWWLLEK